MDIIDYNAQSCATFSKMARVALSKIRLVKIKRLPEWKRKKKAIIPTFSDMSLRPDVVESLKAMNVVEPTWIQVSLMSMV